MPIPVLRLLLTISCLLFAASQTTIYGQPCNANANAGMDITACANDPNVQLNGSATGDVAGFFWTPPAGLSDPNSLNPIVTIPTNTTYTLHVVSPNNTNLITNGDFELGNTAFFSDYGYVDPSNPLGLINPGTYTVVTSPAAVSSNLPPCDDHTFGNGTGQMMVINGNGTIGANLWCQTIPINANTTYDFSAWVGSLIPLGPAQVQFSANGVLIGSVFNASGGTCAWEYMSASWFSAGATSLDLCLVNQNPSGSIISNNFALDDIEMYGTCEVTDEVNVTFVEALADVAAPPIFDCNAADPCLQLDAGNSSMGPTISYLWTTSNGDIQSGANTPFPIVCSPGDYTLVVSNFENGITCDSDPFVVTVIDNGQLPPTPVIIGEQNPCEDEAYNYTITDHPAYHQINWIVPPMGTIIFGQNTNDILIEWSSPGMDLLCVEVSNACATPNINCLNIEVNLGPAIDSLESFSNPCPNALATYTVANPDPTAYLFNWTVPTGATLQSGQGSSSIDVLWGSNGGQVCVTATNDCGDSTYCQVINLQNAISNNIDTLICAGDSLFLAGSFQDTSGIYIDSLLSFSGCDSLVFTTLTIDTIPPNYTSLTTCDSTLAGIFSDTLQTLNGCDSILVLEIIYSGEYLEQRQTQTCDSTLAGIFSDTLQTLNGCDSILVLEIIYSGEYLEQSQTQTCDSTLAGIFSDTLQTLNGCDSILVLEIIYSGEYLEQRQTQTCDSTLAGIFSDTLQTINGCDSILVLEIIYSGEYLEQRQTQTCDSTLAGIFSDTLQTINGCDSILILEVIYTGEYLEQSQTQTCDSTLAGIFSDTLQTLNGCDSILILEVIYTGEYLEQTQTQTCDSTLAGIFSDTLQTLSGCDSILILEVIYTGEYLEQTQMQTCDSTLAGIFSDTLQTLSGCDSILILEVIYTGEYLEQSQTQTCDSTLAGIFSDTLQTLSGCDSILILEVIYTGEYLEQTQMQTCDSTLAGIFSDTLQTLSGCDSILILEVIYTGEYLEQTQTQTCDPTLAGIFFDTLQTQNGCDSILILEVIYSGEYLEQTQIQICDSTLAGIFSDTLQTINGCDSIIVLEVIYAGEYLEQTQSQTCDASLAGVFSDTLQTLNGCDSILVVEVVYVGSDTTYLSTMTCDSAMVGTFVQSLPNTFNCDSIIVETINLLPLDSCALQATAIAMEIPCSESTGAIELLVMVGAGPFVYQWEGPGTNPLGTGTIDNLQTTTLISGLEAGEYTITITASNGLTTILQVALTALAGPALMDLQTSDYDGFGLSCADAADGYIEIFPEGGTGPYMINWSEGSSGALVSELEAGWYEYTITDATACQLVDSVELTAPMRLLPEIEIQAESCPGEADASIQVANIAGGIAPFLFSLDGQAFSTEQIFVGLNPGAYEVMILDDNGCQVSQMVNVPASSPLVVDLGEDQIIALGSSVPLYATANLAMSDIDSIFWNPKACDQCLDPIVQPLIDTEYEVIIRDRNGCIASDHVFLRVINQKKIFLPSGMSPNGDGTNDRFVVYAGPEVERVVSASVYSRWGEVLYHAKDFLPNDPTLGWDGSFRGKAMDPGVYVYQVKVAFIDGTEVLLSGDITLIR